MQSDSGVDNKGSCNSVVWMQYDLSHTNPWLKSHPRDTTCLAIPVRITCGVSHRSSVNPSWGLKASCSIPLGRSELRCVWIPVWTILSFSARIVQQPHIYTPLVYVQLQTMKCPRCLQLEAHYNRRGPGVGGWFNNKHVMLPWSVYIKINGLLSLKCPGLLFVPVRACWVLTFIDKVDPGKIFQGIRKDVFSLL